MQGISYEYKGGCPKLGVPFGDPHKNILGSILGSPDCGKLPYRLWHLGLTRVLYVSSYSVPTVILGSLLGVPISLLLFLTQVQSLNG